MSQENVDRVHRGFDAFNRRDLDALLAFMDPEVEFTALSVEMEGTPSLRGHDGIREWWRGLLAVFPDYTLEIREVRDLGDSMIVAMRGHGHGLESDAPIDEAFWSAVKVRDGKTIWFRIFRSEAEALEAAGLRE